MGIFTDFVEMNGLTEGAHMSTVNEAELAEEMEKLENAPSYDFGDMDIEECCIESMLINERNYSNIMMSVAHEEMQYFVEHGEEMPVNEASIGGFFDKIKDMINRAWEKIKSIFEKCLATINSWISTDRRFVEKYSETIKSADKGCFKFTGYNVPSNYADKADAGFNAVANCLSDCIKDLNSGSKSAGKRTASDLAKEYLYQDDETAEQTLRQIRENMGIHKQVKLELTPAIVITELKEGKDNKKCIKSSYAHCKTSIAGMKKDIEQAKRDAEQKSKKKANDKNTSYTVLGGVSSQALTYLSSIQKIMIKAANCYHANARKAAARAVRGYSNESYEFEYGTDISSTTERYAFLQ